MQVRSSHHLTAILQAGNCNQTTWQYTNWDNATHVVQPKHQHVFVQYHWFARRLEEKHALRICEVMQVRTHLTALFLSRQLQPNNLPVCKLYQIATMQPMWSNPNIHTSLSNAKLWQCNPCGVTQTSTRICSVPLVCTKVGRKFMQLEYGNECRCAPSHSSFF